MALMFDGLDSRKHHQLIIKHQPFHQNNKPSNITNCHPFKGGRFRGHDIPAALHCNTLQGTRFVRCGPDDLGDDLTVIEGFHIMDMEGMTNKYFELCNGMGVLAEKRVFGMVWMLIIVTILGHTKNRKDVFTPQDFIGVVCCYFTVKSNGVRPPKTWLPPRRPCVLPADLFVTYGNNRLQYHAFMYLGK